MSMFEKASRAKLRFSSGKGLVSVEDLWDLPMTQLDRLAIALRKELRELGEADSFIEAPKRGIEELQLKFDLAKYVIEVRLAENAAEKKKQDNAAQKQKILEILGRKQDAALEGKSVEELMALASSL